ncbi:hypothetical protein [Methylobacterium sp. GXF4]|uniref:hypothetical protein n=1 Tax=Methylobacterium sp. GXF4 TaxID=1096546 RepID=UPI000FFEB904|nr:hypothetical protein [Methylobacterium sp. GXF4]
MNITVSPAGKGRYYARLGDRLLTTSYTPFFSAARVLKAEGVRWDEPLTMTHEGSETICLRSTIGEASMLTVEDNDRGLNLRPYRPNPFGRPE